MVVVWRRRFGLGEWVLGCWDEGTLISKRRKRKSCVVVFVDDDDDDDAFVAFPTELFYSCLFDGYFPCGTWKSLGE